MIQKIKRIRKGSSYQNIFFLILIGSLLIFVIGFLAFSNLKISQRRAELITKIEDFKKETQLLEKKIQELQAGIVQTESEEYWEERIREQGYKKPGEEQVVVLPPGEGEVEKEEISFLNPQSWLEWIKNKIAGLVERFNVTFPR
jgi:cell division protein FtsB